MYQEIEKKIKVYCPFSNISVLEYNGYNKKVCYKCNLCGQKDWRNSYRTFLSSKYACKKCQDGQRPKSETQKKIENLLTKDIVMIQWNGVNKKTELFCKKCNSTILRLPQNILKNPEFCPNCGQKASSTPRTKEEAQDMLNKYAGNEDFTLLEYTNSEKPRLIKHKCGFIFKRKIWNFKISRGCPKCDRKKSKLEQEVENYLIKNNIRYNFQVHFKDCNKGKSSFDFQCFNEKGQSFLIEVQGQQHYHEVEIFDSLEKQRERDQIKKEYCEAKNIFLIEIPFFDINNLDKYLSFLKSSTTISEESTQIGGSRHSN